MRGVLTVAAMVTSRARLGTSALIAATHTPVQLAKSFATIDQISGGRMIAGIAAGWSSDELHTLGATRADRGRLLDEMIDVFNAVWGPGNAADRHALRRLAPGRRARPVRGDGPHLRPDSSARRRARPKSSSISVCSRGSARRDGCSKSPRRSTNVSVRRRSEAVRGRPFTPGRASPRERRTETVGTCPCSSSWPSCWRGARPLKPSSSAPRAR